MSVDFEMNKQKKRSTFGLRLDQLADLFGVAADDHAPTEADCAHEHLEEALRRQLTEVMPGNSLLLTTVSKMAESDVTAMIGKSLLQALTDP